MSRNDNKRSPNHKGFAHCQQVRVFGRGYPVIGEVRVRRRTYLLLDRLSAGADNYLAFDPFGGPNGRAIRLLVLPRSFGSRQHLGVLQRVSESSGNFASILDYDSAVLNPKRN